jgi:alcohol dehydrogenase
MIIAVGGPEVQALARTAAIIGPSHHDTFDFIDGALPPGPFLPYIAVPVAGSDPFLLSPHYILTDPRDRLVKLVKAPREVCRAVFLDSGVAGAASETYPDAAAFDGFLAALEAWCSRKANALSDMLLEKALACYGSLWHRWRLHPAPSGGQDESGSGSTDADAAGMEDGEPSMPPGFDGGEIAAEGAFFLALGTAIAPPGPGTALAWAVSGRFPVERAIVSASLLSHTAERLAAVRPEKAARAAELVPGAGNLVERINAALDASGIPFKLRDVGLNLDRLVSAAEAGRALEFVGQSPWTASAEDVFELLKAAY